MKKTKINITYMHMQNSQLAKDNNAGCDITKHNALCHYIKSTYGKIWNRHRQQRQFVRLIYNKENL
jgi:hypothetical protein